MRQGPTGRRPRGRPNRKQHGGPSRPHNSFDSNGPEGRVRGNAHQVYEKYVGMAREAMSAGDRVAAETYFQHAEHYFRIINSSTDPQPDERRQPRPDGNGRPPQARPDEANGSAPSTSDDDGDDREGLDRALGFGGPGAGPRQPQGGQDAPGQARTRHDEGHSGEGNRGEGQPRDAQSPDQPHGRRPMRPRPPRDGDQADGQERRVRRPQQGNGHGQTETNRPDAAKGGDAAHDQALNGEDTSATDEPTSGNEPVSA
jgi:Domain of unknown function (DUF4167)